MLYPNHALDVALDRFHSNLRSVHLLRDARLHFDRRHPPPHYDFVLNLLKKLLIRRRELWNLLAG